MVYRIFVEKKPGLAGEADSLRNDLRTLLGMTALENVRLFNRYDVENMDEALFRQCSTTIFSEPQLDDIYDELPATEGAVFAVEFLPGQYDQRADSAAQCVQLVSQGERPLVRSAKVYILEGKLTAEDVAAAQKYVINPVEALQLWFQAAITQILWPKILCLIRYPPYPLKAGYTAHSTP